MTINYTADKKRYDTMQYRKCGTSGIVLPLVSLGLWQNFGSDHPYSNSKEMVLRAFDLGINHFDLANNYGPVPGGAEETFGKILKDDLMPYRDELIISSKAGYDMWPGPYGTSNSSRKYLFASLDQSLKRMGLDYVDIFYSHRYNENTPLEETMSALADMVKQGKALYVGISSYDHKKTKEASDIIGKMGVPLLIHQPNYSMLNRWIESDLQGVLKKEGIGSIAFCPLAQGLLTSKYLNETPIDSRAARHTTGFSDTSITPKVREMLNALNNIADKRGQTLAQLALAWVLRDEKVTSVLIGASRVAQIEENVKAIENLSFTKAELDAIDKILASN